MDSAAVELHYGPYESHGLIKHKIQRLHGISEYLTILGYEIEYIPTIHLNRLSVVMKECEIFRCDIRNLLFNMSFADDKVGHRLVATLEEARKRLYGEKNLPSYNPVKDGMRTLQKERDAGELQELLVDDAKVMFEIPLHLAKAYRHGHKLKLKGFGEREEVVGPHEEVALIESSQVDVREGEGEAEAEKDSVEAESSEG